MQDYKVKKRTWPGHQEVNYFAYLPKGKIICNYIIPDSFLFSFHLKTFNKRSFTIPATQFQWLIIFIIRRLYGAFEGVISAWIDITALCLLQAQALRAVKPYQHRVHWPSFDRMSISSNRSPLQFHWYLLKPLDLL